MVHGVDEFESSSEVPGGHRRRPHGPVEPRGAKVPGRHTSHGVRGSKETVREEGSRIKGREREG